jgi:hypothetical protein
VVAVGPCEAVEIAAETLGELTRRRPLAREIVEETQLIRATGLEAVAVRSVPPMDPDLPLRALRLLESHLGQKDWNPRMRLRLAELLAKAGCYADVVPLLVGLADELAAAGQHTPAVSVLKKIEGIGERDGQNLAIAPLKRVLPAPGERPGPEAAIANYVATGRPAPTAKAAASFQQWVHDLMRDARDEGPATASRSPLAGSDGVDLLTALDHSHEAVEVTVVGEANEARDGSSKDSRPSGLPSAG